MMGAVKFLIDSPRTRQIFGIQFQLNYSYGSRGINEYCHNNSQIVSKFSKVIEVVL